MRKTDQDDLIERCRKGDNEAFDEVYSRFARSMLNSCMRILNNLADAEGMVQESFIDANIGIGNLSDRSTISSKKSDGSNKLHYYWL